MFAVLPAGCILKDDGPSTGPGLEPPVMTGNPGSDSSGVPPVPTAGSGAPLNPSSGTGAPDPVIPGPGMGAAGAGAAGTMATPPGDPGAAGTGAAAAGSGGGGGAFGNDSDAGMACEADRLPALGVDQRIIAPPADAGLPDPDPCEYTLPEGAAPYLPDLVNLEHTQEGQRQTVPRVAGPYDCNPLLGGFYYDDALNPTRIIACDATCVRIALGGMVEIVLGCPTETL